MRPGAVLDYRAIDPFYDHPRVQGLAEMMNYVGAVAADNQVLEKITAAQAHHKKIDGHAPGLAGMDLNAYVAAGVYSDHECYNMEDALNKLRLGQYIMIREGTAARNLDALVPLLTPQYADRCMFCSDDKHPSDLLEKGHIDYNCRRGHCPGCGPHHRRQGRHPQRRPVLPAQTTAAPSPRAIWPTLPSSTTSSPSRCRWSSKRASCGMTAR